MEHLISYLPGALSGIVLLHYTSNDNSKVKKTLPKLKLHQKIELLPNVRVNFRDKTIHFHHWLNFLVLLAVAIPTNTMVLDAHFTKGFLIGGILQGLSYQDSFKMVYQSKKKSGYRFLNSGRN